MIIATWNINGIRTTLSKTPLKKLFQELGCDMICLQETKITAHASYIGDCLDESTAIVEECNSYFSHSKVKSGYSGVAIFTKNNFTPISAEEGLTGKLRTNQSAPDSKVGHPGDDLTQFSDDLTQFSDDELLALDAEGRCLMTEHIILDNEERERKLVIINVYCPRADPDRPERLSFKLRFYQLLQIKADALLKRGRHVVVVGDINTIHKPIDHCDPANDEEFMKDPGRQWMDEFLCSTPTQPPPSRNENNFHLPELQHHERQANFVDLLRLFEPKTANLFTNWCSSTGARATNYGCRLDYIFADIEFASTYCRKCYIRPDIMGSDHCPVVAHFNCRVIPAERCPPLCSKYLPQFAGKQTKLSNYFISGDLSSQESCSGNGDGVSNNCSSSSFSFSCNNDSYEKSNKNNLPLNIANNKRTLNGKCKKPSKLKTDSKSIIKFLTHEKLHTNSETHSATEIKTNSDDSVDNLADTKNGRNLIVENLKITTATSNPQPASQIETKPPQSKPTKLNESWGKLLRGPPKSPYCTGHKEPCVLRTVKKEGPNKGKQFWVCNRPEGHKSNPAARCDYFLWIHEK